MAFYDGTHHFNNPNAQVLSGNYTSSVFGNKDNGDITISYGGPRADSDIGKNTQIVLTPIIEDNTISKWDCQVQGEWKESYIPSLCTNSHKKASFIMPMKTTFVNIYSSSSDNDNEQNFLLFHLLLPK